MAVKGDITGEECRALEGKSRNVASAVPTARDGALLGGDVERICVVEWAGERSGVEVGGVERRSGWTALARRLLGEQAASGTGDEERHRSWLTRTRRSE